MITKAQAQLGMDTPDSIISVKKSYFHEAKLPVNYQFPPCGIMAWPRGGYL